MKRGTCLHLAVKLELGTNAIRQLTEAGVDVNVQDEDGNTPLHLALKYEDITVAKHLMFCEGRTEIEKDARRTAMSCGSENAKAELRQHLEMRQ